MKRLMILAISAILVANVSAQETKQVCKGKKMISKEERVEKAIAHFTTELSLSEKQAKSFAATYREYTAKMGELFQKQGFPKKAEGQQLTEEELDQMAKKRFAMRKDITSLQEKFYGKFRKDLDARQVARVMHLNKAKTHNDGFGKKHKAVKRHPGKNFEKGKKC